MTGWRDHKRKMRRDVHQHMRVPSLYVVRTGAEPRRVDVRQHTKFQETGPAGAPQGSPELADITPRIIFSRAEVPSPQRDAVVVVSETEMYRVDHSRPPDDQWITAEVVQLTQAQATALWDPDWAELLA